MNHLAAAYCAEQKSSSPASLVRRMLTLAEHAMRPIQVWASGNAALGGNSAAYPALFTDHAAQAAICFNGAIYNAPELRSRLGLEPTACSAQAVLETYLSLRGQTADFCRMLDGDFAFVIWDQKFGRMIAARDCFGVCPLCYHWDGSSLLIAGETRQILNTRSFTPKLDYGYLGQYLIGQIATVTASSVQNISRLPPAHYLELQGTALNCRRYWEMPVGPPASDSDQAFAEKFRELFFRAVQRRVQSASSCAVQLSGGLDSSAIACVLPHLNLPQPPRLGAVSLRFPDHPCDEGRFIAEVIARTGLRGIEREAGQAAPGWAADEVKKYADVPNYQNGLLSCQILEKSRAEGFAVCLSGYGGDEVVSGGRASYLRKFRNFAAGFLPRSVKDPLKRAVPAIDWIPQWVTAKARQDTQLDECLRTSVGSPSGCSMQQVRLYQMLFNGWALHMREIEARSCAAAGVDVRYPFFDKALIEFCFNLPENQLTRGGVNKYILRAALRAELPELIAARPDKADFSHTGFEVLEALGGRALFEQLAIYDFGWVDRKDVLEFYKAMSEGYHSGNSSHLDQTWTLWSIYGTSLLLEHDLSQYGPDLG